MFILNIKNEIHKPTVKRIKIKLLLGYSLEYFINSYVSKKHTESLFNHPFISFNYFTSPLKSHLDHKTHYPSNSLSA